MFGIEITKMPDIKGYIQQVSRERYQNMNKLGFAIVREAKKKAPVYRGMLRNRIVHEVKTSIMPLDHTLRVYVPVKENGFYYASAVEHGTRPHYPPFDPIRRWVWLKRGGLGVSDKEVDSTAWAIVRKIGRVGTKPHPFLHPSAKNVLRTWRWWK